MKISIDAYNISLLQGTGVATYGRNLVQAAAELGHDVSVLFGARTTHSKTPLLNEIAITEINAPNDKVSKKKSRFKSMMQGVHGILSSRTAREIKISGQVILPDRLQLGNSRYYNIPSLYSTSMGSFRVTGSFTRINVTGTDLFHWTYPLPIRMPGAFNVYTLHDLVPLRLPYATADFKRSYYHLCKRIVRNADHILTVSENSKMDIINILDADENRVTNIYQSSDMEDYLINVNLEDVQSYVEGLLGIEFRKYFLFFGAIEPKKNIARIIEAYISSNVKTRLVIVGAPGWGSNHDVKLLKSIAALDRSKRIIWLNYLPRDMLAMVIAGARATIFPSLYEGFGLPVLESMLLGTPVITSNISSLPEIAGDAALFVDPYNVRSISAKIRQLDSDESLCIDLSQRGREQSNKFSKKVYSDRLNRFYLKAMG